VTDEETDDGKVIRTNLSSSQADALGQVAFNPEHLDLELNREEKLRVTALMFAIRQYTDFIIKDADMYNAIVMRNGTIKPASTNSVVNMAIEFHQFLRGDFVERQPLIEDERGAQGEGLQADDPE